MADLVVSANVDTLMQSADFAAFRTSLSLTALATTTPGTGVATFLTTPSSANLALAVTGETGSGALMFGTSPSVTTSLVAASATMALWNTVATTVNAFGATTALNIGAAAATVLNFGGHTSAAELRFLEPSASGTDYSGFKQPARATSITYLLPAVDPTDGQILSCLADGTMSWTSAGGGSGDVTAASAFGTDNRLIRSDGTGKGVQASLVSVADDGAITTPATIEAGDGGGSYVRVFPAGTLGFTNYQTGWTDPGSWALPAIDGGVGTLATTDDLKPTTKFVSTGTYTVGTTNSAELFGGIIYVTGAATIVVPAYAVGYHFTVITVGAVAVSVDCDAGDKFILDGTALTDGHKITNLSTAGDIAVITDYDATGFYAATNGWTDGG